MTSAKNNALSPAAVDLGLGDQLTQQLADQEMERKKKIMGGAGRQSMPAMYGDSTMGLAVMNLYGS